MVVRAVGDNTVSLEGHFFVPCSDGWKRRLVGLLFGVMVVVARRNDGH